MTARSGEFDAEMNRLEAEIKRLEAEYTMFFSGRLPRLPWETRAKVEQLVKHYDRMNLRNTAERFRFGTIQTRFTKFSELWDKHLKAREEGRVPGGRVPPPPISGPREVATPTASPRNDVVAEATIRDPGRDTEQVRELYERLSQARREAGEQPLPFDRFAAVIKAQIAKHGGGAVSFRVAEKDGKVALAAQPKKD